MIASKSTLAVLAILGIFVLAAAFFYFPQEPVHPTPVPLPDPLLDAGAQPELKPLTPEEERELQNEAAEIIKTKDFGKCQAIENLLYRTVCTNNIALNLAQETQDISYCQKLDNELVSIANCERQVLFEKSLDKEDISVCNEAENHEIQSDCQETFWPRLAIKNGDSSVCGNLKDEQEKNNCHDNYLLREKFTGNEADFDCQSFYSQEAKQDCEIYKELIPNGELLTCSNLKSDLFLNHCMMSKVSS